jgi:GT2 family glycosyltransferase
MRVLEIELEQPLPFISAFSGERRDDSMCPYTRVLCLVRLHTQPLGLVEFPLGEQGAEAQEYLPYIWANLSTEINEHLRQDNLPAIASLDDARLPSTDTPLCVQERQQFLEHAPFTSVIIPTHNRPDRIQTCLSYLLKQDYPSFEIVVVDNASSDNATVKLIAEKYADEPRVRYVRENRPGSAYARNTGMLAAKGKYLAFADDDVAIDTHWLTELMMAFRGGDDVACTTGLILPLELETEAQFWLEEYGGFGKGFTQQVYDLQQNRPANRPLYPYTAGSFGSGASMAFRAEYLRSARGFDGVLEHGADIEAFFQVIIRGYKLVYVPSAIVYHPHHKAYEKLRNQLHIYGQGLTGFLTKAIVTRPMLLLDLISKVPYGFFFVLSPGSPKNTKKQANYPQELTRVELKGMAIGPFTYLYRHWTNFRNRKQWQK